MTKFTIQLTNHVIVPSNLITEHISEHESGTLAAGLCDVGVTRRDVVAGTVTRAVTGSVTADRNGRTVRPLAGVPLRLEGERFVIGRFKSQSW